jgi:hypothetical protein
MDKFTLEECEEILWKILNNGWEVKSEGDTECFFCGVDLGFENHANDCIYDHIHRRLVDKGAPRFGGYRG